MTSAQAKLQKRFHKLMEDILAEASKAGATDPHIFFEGTSGLVVFANGDHNDNTHRPDDILFYFRWPEGHAGKFDAGGF